VRIAVNTLAVSDSNEGIRTMLVGLVEALVRADPADTYLLICSRANEHLFLPAASSSGGRVRVRVLGRNRSPLARIVHDQVTVPWLVRHDVDLLLTPASVGSVVSAVPQVVIVPHHLSVPSIRRDAGLEPFSLPYRLYFGPIMRLSHRRAAAVAPISQDLGQALVADTGLSPTKVEPILCGIDAGAFASGAYQPPASPGYALFVSTLYPYKNAAAVVRAIASARSRLPEGFRAVIVGRDPDGRQIPALAQLSRDLRIDDVIELTGKVSDVVLAQLYAGAAVFVFPSLAEGFGFPALEAMAIGLPVIVSDRSALPEVVAGAGLTVDPHQPDQLADAIVRVVGDDALRNQMIKAGVARTEELTWDRAARQFVALFHRLAG
jgi:glycosyltransferase involved in cell wall biosynthesis